MPCAWRPRGSAQCVRWLNRGARAPQSVKDLPILQDGPPPGGFPAIRIERRLPSTGPTGVTIFAVVIASVTYGYYRVSSGRAAARPGPVPVASLLPMAWLRRPPRAGERLLARP